MLQDLLKKFYDNQETALSYGWVIGIVFFLVLFLSQTLYIWIIGSVGSFSIWLLLIIWSAVVTYVLLFGRGNKQVQKLKDYVESLVDKEPLYRLQTDIEDVPETEKLMVIEDEEEQETEYSGRILSPEEIEQMAHKEGALIGNSGVKFIADFGVDAEVVLRKVLKVGKVKYPKFDGWIVLNLNQIKELAKEAGVEVKDDEPEVQQPVVEEHRVEQKVEAPEKKIVEQVIKDREVKEIEPPSTLPTGSLQSVHGGAVSSFIQLLCEGNQQELFSFMRGMRQGEESNVAAFLNEAVVMLDRVHEHRVDGVGFVEKDILEYTKCFSNKELEELIAILVGSIDSRYTLPELGVKISLIRAAEYIKKSRNN